MRMFWGFANTACTAIISLGLALGGYLESARLIEYILATVVIAVGLTAIIRSNLNLRLRDPSMTAAQILLPLPPALYIMFFITEPGGRMAFLLMATGGLLFGTLGLDRRQMLAIGGVIFTSYFLLLLALWNWAPERVQWPLEAVILFAYASVLCIVAYLGSFITSLRSELRARNRSLNSAVSELEELASRDHLTGLLNRRRVMEHLQQQADAAARRQAIEAPLCLSILDVDDFKTINDTWGHQAGDAILRRIAESLVATVRKTDLAGRIGGEEFLLIFPETDRKAAELAADRVRTAVAGLSFDELPPGYTVTVSQGLAIHQPGESIETTMQRADQALYQAKNNGKNRVVLAATVASPPGSNPALE